ncbi:MAG: PEP-CTERM sorting domain-containing protein [Opitutales bacterium]
MSDSHCPTPTRLGGLVALCSAAFITSLPGPALATVSGINGLIFEGIAPTVDLTDADFNNLGVDFIRPGGVSPDGRPDVTDSTTNITGYTTPFGTVSTLAGPVQITNLQTFPTGLEPPIGDVIRNVWGFQGPELPGANSALGLNVGAGLDNAGATGDPDNPIAPFQVHFGTWVGGSPGVSNDFFIMDIIGDDAVDLAPLDIYGNVIGDFVLRLASGPGANNFGNSDAGDFGSVDGTGFDLSLILENGANIGVVDGTVIDDVPLAGISFDIEDFEGTGSLNQLAGFEVRPLALDPSISSGQGSLDLIAAGYNTAGTIPEPGMITFFGLGLAGILIGLRHRQAKR